MSTPERQQDGDPERGVGYGGPDDLEPDDIGGESDEDRAARWAAEKAAVEERELDERGDDTPA